jgi:outer membrane protein
MRLLPREWSKALFGLWRKANRLQTVKYLPVILCTLSMPVLSYEGGDIILRVGYANVDFREDSNPVLVDGVLELGDLSVESQRTPLLTIATMFNERWGVEIFIPFSPLALEADGKGGFIDGLPMGTADIWPLAIAFQYYPFETKWVKPYIGIGANYTFINNEKIDKNTASLLGIERIESIDADDSFGWLFQLGVDFPITKNLMINLSSTYLELNLDATGAFYANGVRSTLSAKMGVKTQPNIAVVGVSYRF